MICPICGAQVNRGAKFCGVCGTVIQPPAQQYSGGSPVPGAMQNQAGMQMPGAMQNQAGMQMPGAMQNQAGTQMPGAMQNQAGMQMPGAVNNPGSYPMSAAGQKPGFTAVLKTGVNSVMNTFRSGGMNQKKTYTIIGVSALAVVLILCLILNNVIFGFSGSLNKFMKAYKDCDGEGMYKVTSKIMKNAVYTYADDNADDMKYLFGSDYSSDDINDLLDDFYIEAYEYQAEDFFDAFEDKLGSSYRVTYKVVKQEVIDRNDMEELNKKMHEISNKITFKKVKEVTIEVTGKSKEKTYSKKMKLYMSKESGKWFVMFTEGMDNTYSYMW